MKAHAATTQTSGGMPRKAATAPGAVPSAVALQTPQVRQLLSLQAKAEATIQARALRSLQRMAGNRSAPALQRKITHDPPNITQKNNRAGIVEVENIKGRSFGAAHNSPSVPTFGWPQLFAAGHTLANTNSTHYNAVRMHLWNGRLDGPGDKAWNLAPGPAKTNSSMSAGPETAAKYAVDTGGKIWLKTEVFYQNNGANANDFTNVVPNRMRMEWGYMSFTGARGPAQPPVWDETIDQPAGAMTATQKGQYTALADTDTVALDNLFATASTQEKAQAFDLVTDALKLHIIQNYPEVFANMGGASRAAVLTDLSVPSALHLIQNVMNISNANVLYTEIYDPLIEAGEYARLQALYRAITTNPDHYEQFIAGRWPLIQHLGSAADDEIQSSYRYFRFLPPAEQLYHLEAIDQTDMRAFLHSFPSSTARKAVLMHWAAERGYRNPTFALGFLKKKLPVRYWLELKKGLKWEMRNLVNPGMANRPRRKSSNRRKF